MSTQRVAQLQVALETISNLPSCPSHYLLQPANPSAHQSSRTKFLQRLVRYHLNWFFFSSHIMLSLHLLALVVINSRILPRCFLFSRSTVSLVCNKLVNICYLLLPHTYARTHFRSSSNLVVINRLLDARNVRDIALRIR